MATSGADVSIEQLEGRWPAPGPEASRLVRTVDRLRRIPLSELSAEDLRLLLGQREAVSVVLPIALEMIDADPLTCGDMYPGDLLVAVLRVGESGTLSANDMNRLRRAIDRIRQSGDDSVVAELWERAGSLGLV